MVKHVPMKTLAMKHTCRATLLAEGSPGRAGWSLSRQVWV